MKKILVFTDSLGLSRKQPEYVSFDNSWPEKLKQNYMVHRVSIGGATVEDLHNQLHYNEMFDPDIVVVQSGIVDCAPRALTRLENKVYNKFWVTRKILGFIMPRFKKKIRSARKVSYTSSKTFGHFVNQFKKTFGDKLYWIGILPASMEYEKDLKGIQEKVLTYNSIIQKIVGNNYIDISDIDNDKIMSDNIHLSSLGHEFVVSKVLNALAKKGL